jgi:hypothetical protein
MLKLTFAEDSLAEYRLTGTETSPNEMLAELIGLGGIVPHISRKAGGRKERGKGQLFG